MQVKTKKKIFYFGGQTWVNLIPT